MISNVDQADQQFTQCTLQQILQTDEWILQQFLSINNIHTIIKTDLQTFIKYCKQNEQFTDKLIILGLKCPMHQSNNTSMKKMAFICNDILTCERNEIAELIMCWNHSGQPEPDKKDKNPIERHYKYLDKVVSYFHEPYLDQICINYIAKVLMLLLNWKYIEPFAKYLQKNQWLFQKIIQLSVYPSISCLLSKMLTFSSQYYCSDILNQFKMTVVSALLTKTHEQIDKQPTSLILYSFQQVLNFIRRRGQKQPKDNITHICNLMVSKSEIGYHFNIIFKALTAQNKSKKLLYSLNNSLNYLRILINRIKLNQVNEDQPSQCRPNISFKIDQLFSSFCTLLNLSLRLQQFILIDKPTARLMTLQYLQTLHKMCRLQKFTQFYIKFELNDKIQAIHALITLISEQTSFGIIFQQSIALLQAILLREQSILQKPISYAKAIPPIEIFSILDSQKSQLSVQVYKMANMIRNNKNLKNIHIRKLLMIIDTYLKKYTLTQKHQQIQTLSTLFLQYTPENCKKYQDFILVQCGYPILQYCHPKEQSFMFFKKNQEIRQILYNNSQQQDPENVTKPIKQKIAQQNELKIQNQPTEQSYGQTETPEDKKNQISPVQNSSESPSDRPSIIDISNEETSAQFVQSVS